MASLAPVTVGDLMLAHRLTHPDLYDDKSKGFSAPMGWLPGQRSPEQLAAMDAVFRRGPEPTDG